MVITTPVLPPPPPSPTVKPFNAARWDTLDIVTVESRFCCPTKDFTERKPEDVFAAGVDTDSFLCRVVFSWLGDEEEKNSTYVTSLFRDLRKEYLANHSLIEINKTNGKSAVFEKSPGGSYIYSPKGQHFIIKEPAVVPISRMVETPMADFDSKYRLATLSYAHRYFQVFQAKMGRAMLWSEALNTLVIASVLAVKHYGADTVLMQLRPLLDCLGYPMTLVEAKILEREMLMALEYRLTVRTQEVLAMISQASKSSLLPPSTIPPKTHPCGPHTSHISPYFKVPSLDMIAKFKASNQPHKRPSKLTLGHFLTAVGC